MRKYAFMVVMYAKYALISRTYFRENFLILENTLNIRNKILYTNICVCIFLVALFISTIERGNLVPSSVFCICLCLNLVLVLGTVLPYSYMIEKYAINGSIQLKPEFFIIKACKKIMLEKNEKICKQDGHISAIDISMI